MAIKFCSAILLLCLCYTTARAQRITPDRNPSSPKLVDPRPGYSALYQGSDESRRRNGIYIIKLKNTTTVDDLGRITAKMTDQGQNQSSDAMVQGMSTFSMIGLGLIAMLNDKALDTVSKNIR